MKRQNKVSTKELQAVMNSAEKPGFDHSKIYGVQIKLKNACLRAEKNNTIKMYQKVKYKQQIYQIGEFLHLYDPTEKTPYVVRLHAIIKVPALPEVPAILKVQWLLRKSDLPQKFSKYLPHFSVAEVFPSGSMEYVQIESIMAKCFVISYKEYEYLENAGESIHFSRAMYDQETTLFDPPLQKFPSQCYCKMPVNPDLVYVQCEACEAWIHHDCITDKSLLETEQFYCVDCVKNKQ